MVMSMQSYDSLITGGDEGTYSNSEANATEFEEMFSRYGIHSDVCNKFKFI